MRRTQAIVAAAAAALSSSLLVSAHPFPRDETSEASYLELEARQCARPCGADGQYCCGADEACTTVDEWMATCIPQAGGVWTTYETTFVSVRTKTIVSTITTLVPTANHPAPTIVEYCIPQADNWIQCGPICCDSDYQSCGDSSIGTCLPLAGVPQPQPTGDPPTMPTPTPVPTATITSNGITTTMYSMPYRITSSTFTTGVPAPTESAEAVSGGTGTQLSGGAIAGIVVGVLVGVALLIFLCFCCIVRGLWHTLCGGGDRDRRRSRSRSRVDVVEERYSRHGSRVPSAYSRREKHGGWFGGPRTHSPSSHGKKKGGNKTMMALTAFAGTIAALLFLKKDKKDKKRPARRSQYTDSFSGSSSFSSSSGAPSGAPTRYTRDTRYTRSTRRP